MVSLSCSSAELREATTPVAIRCLYSTPCRNVYGTYTYRKLQEGLSLERVIAKTF